jgi:hypothetical protein
MLLSLLSLLILLLMLLLLYGVLGREGIKVKMDERCFGEKCFEAGP